MWVLLFAVAILAIGATLDMASGATSRAGAHLYRWSNARGGKKCTFDEIGQCEVYAQDVGGWCGLNYAYPGSLPPLNPNQDSW